ncbi:acetyltransferase, partial [Dehalococcoides mccartyi]
MYTIDKATIKDATTIHKLVNNFADHGQMLARSLAEIYENLRDFYVIRGDNGEVIACAALHISWA